MLSKERSNTTKLFYFALFIAVNGLSCVLIPFFLDYAHNFLNGIIIPDRLRWDDNNQLRANPVGWFTAQALIVLVEFIGLLWLLHRFNQRNIAVWLTDEPMQIIDHSVGKLLDSRCSVDSELVWKRGFPDMADETIYQNCFIIRLR